MDSAKAMPIFPEDLRDVCVDTQPPQPFLPRSSGSSCTQGLPALLISRNLYDNNHMVLSWALQIWTCGAPRRPSSTSLSIAQRTLQLCTTWQSGVGRAEDSCRCPQQRLLVGPGLSFALTSAFALESAIQQLVCPAIPASHGTAEPLSGGHSRSFAQAL